MSSEYSIRHQKPILVTEASLIELDEILKSARSAIISNIARDSGTTVEFVANLASEIESGRKPDSKFYELIHDIEHKTEASYSIRFKSGYKPTKKSILGLLETLSGEPDEPTEIEVKLGQSYVGVFVVKLGNEYGDNITIDLNGSDEQAEAIVRRLRNWLILHKPDYAWARMMPFRAVAAVLLTITLLLTIASVFDASFVKNPWEILTIPDAAKFTTSFGILSVSVFFYWAQTLLFPNVEFQIGWFRRKIKVRRSLIAAAAAMVILPVILHVIGAT